MRGLKFYTIDGRKQDPKCLDFHITPVLTLGIAPADQLKNIASGYMLAIEWGFWAVVVLTYKIKQ